MTTPVAAPAMATNGSDFDPMASIWRTSSANSKGGVTTARATRPQNAPSSPNHSKKLISQWCFGSCRKPSHPAEMVAAATTMPKYNIDEHLAQSIAAIVPNLEISEKTVETGDVTE